MGDKNGLDHGGARREFYKGGKAIEVTEFGRK